MVWSQAHKNDVTGNRVSNNLITEALFDPTPAAYNPFSGGVDSNIERALIDVYRKGDTGLFMLDAKFSNPSLFEAPAGPVGALIGVEHRREWFSDDRDPRLDGTIPFTDYDGDTFPFVSDVVNSSPTPDNEGSRRVDSLFFELAAPLADKIDTQVALRYERFSDVGDAVVGKIAGGWQLMPMAGVRASWSESFRVPNLVTVNEDIVARQNTRTDWACVYAANTGGDPDQDVLDCVNSVQRTAQGSELLVPERSDNISVGLVLDLTDYLTITADYWSIEKEDTIGLFGEENHTVLDLVERLNQGNSGCSSFLGNEAVVRATPDDEDAIAVYTAAGICPAGDVLRIDDQYANLDTRSLNGVDVGIYLNFESESLGRWKASFLMSSLHKFEQEAGGQAAVLIDAQESGLIPGNIPVVGFDDLIQEDGFQKYKSTLLVTWRKNDWGASLSGTTIGEFYQDSLTLSDGTRYWIPSMTTWNARADYRFEFNEVPTRLRVGVRNLLNERAPLADRYFGFFADAHRDYGRYVYADLTLTWD